MARSSRREDAFANSFACEGRCCDAPVEEMVSLWKNAPAPRDAEKIRCEIELIKPDVYARKCFLVPPPSATEVQEALSREADREVRTPLFWKVWQLKDAYVRDRIRTRYEEAFEKWNQQKSDFEAREDKAQQKHDAEALKECEHQRDELGKALAGDEEYVSRALGSWVEGSNAPLAFKLKCESCSNGEIVARVLLSSPDQLPSTTTETLKSGKIKEKSKTQRAIREEYACYLFALTAYVGQGLFNLSPSISRVVISDYRSAGVFGGEECVFSVAFDRAGFVDRIQEDLDAETFCLSFDNHCAMTKTKVIKAVEPLERGSE